MTVKQMEIQEESEDTLHGRYLTFVVGNEIFGIEIRHVIEIIGMQPIISLPEAPKYFKGIINLRGGIIPVIDMGLKLGKQEIGYTNRTCIIVIETQQITAGLIVDQVAEVMDIEDENIVSPPDLNIDSSKRYLSGIGKVNDEVNLLLNCEAMFINEEVQVIDEIN